MRRTWRTAIWRPGAAAPALAIGILCLCAAAHAAVVPVRRASQATAGASGTGDGSMVVGQNDLRFTQPGDFSPFSYGAGASAPGASANGQHSSTLTFDPAGGSLTGVTASGTASAGVSAPRGLEGNGGASLDLVFDVTDSPVQFSLSGSVSSGGQRSNGHIDLFRAGGDFQLISQIVDDSCCPQRVENFPASGVLQPGRYQLSGSAAAHANPVSWPGGTGSFTLQMTFTLLPPPPPPAAEIRWVNPAGGTFSTTANWDPQRVPEKTAMRADTALFDLDQAYNVSVDGARTVERLIVRDGRVQFTGETLTAAALSPTEPSVTVGGDGRLNVVDGELRSVHAIIGNTPPANPQNPPVAEVLVSNDSTDWITSGSGNMASGNIAVGGAGKGRLFVANGAVVTSGAATIGGPFGGEATVGGQGSRWVTGNLALGIAGSLNLGTVPGPGMLNIEAGGIVDSNEAVIGQGTGLGSRVNVTGRDSQGNPSHWTISNALKVGAAGSGRLEVTAGASAVAIDDIEIATQAAATGTVIVSGAGSPSGIPLASQRTTFGSISDVRVGRGGVGELIVEGGAIAGISEDLVIGDISEGSVTVRGTLPGAGVRTTLTAKNVVVGDLDHGRLVIEGGAEVLSDTGRVGSNAAPPGDTTSGEVFVRGASAGTTPASVWRVDENLDVGTDIESAGRITMQGGRLDIGGTLTVGPRGTLLGIGTVVAGSRVRNGGIVAAGLSPGTLTIDGDFEQLADGVLEIEIGGSSAGIQHDQLVVSGSIIANGILDIHVVNAGSGFQLPNLGEGLMFLNAGGGVSGTFQNSASLRSVAGGSLVDWSLTPGGNMYMLRATAITRLVDGDYNGNGVVDAADYVVWRHSIGGINLAADGNRDGIIDQLDYNVWRSQFGAGNAGTVGGATVPEPATTTLLSWALARCFVTRRSLSRFSKLVVSDTFR